MPGSARKPLQRFTFPIRFASRELSFAIASDAVKYVAERVDDTGSNGTMTLHVPAYEPDARSYAKIIFAMLQIAGRNREIDSIDFTPRPLGSGVMHTDHGHTATAEIAAGSRMIGLALTPAQLQQVETMVLALDESHTRARLIYALLRYRRVVTNSESVDQFSGAWGGLEGLLKRLKPTGGKDEKKPPIKDFFVARYSSIAPADIYRTVDDTYDVRNNTDHANMNDHPRFPQAHAWAMRAFAEALADRLGVDIGNELTFN